MRFLRGPVLFILLLISQLALAQVETPKDSDRDGLSDTVEQQLLEQFRPTFMIAAHDCAVAPAEFAKNAIPTVTATNGTIYGQAFRSSRSTAEHPLVELHYYHLWSKDCGRLGHKLDAEHVSTLVELAPDGSSATARYWFAAAHQETVCDASNGAKAAALNATDHGPLVWISSGKHASYLTQEACAHSCGDPHCEKAVAVPHLPIVNLGELGAPMNGAAWISSSKWPLAHKLSSDFTDEILAELDSQRPDQEYVRLSSTPASAQSVIAAGNTTVNGVATGKEKTGNALGTAATQTGKSLKNSYKSVTKALGKDDKHEQKK